MIDPWAFAWLTIVLIVASTMIVMALHRIADEIESVGRTVSGISVSPQIHVESSSDKQRHAMDMSKWLNDEG